jgi:hypothetical protein
VRLDRLYVVERVKHIYDQHGLSHFASDAFADTTLRQLTAAFQARGVRVDPLDDLESLLSP